MTGIYIQIKKSKSQLNLKNPAEIYNKLAHRGNYLTFSMQTNNFILFSCFQRHLMEYHDCICSYESEDNSDPDFCVIDGQIFNLSDISIGNSEHEITTAAKKMYHLFKTEGLESLKKINGIYSVVLKIADQFIAIKDPIGNNPLYIAEQKEFIIFASELKSLPKDVESTWILPPGSAFFYDTKNNLGNLQTFYDVDQLLERVKNPESNINVIKQNIMDLLSKSVHNAISVNGTVGALLSGGIDSSIICALALKENPNTPLFTIGVQDSKDIVHAKLFSSQYPDIEHYIHTITFEDIKKEVPNVIKSLETFDAALIRSAIPMYILCSKAKNKIDVLLTGEGADELFGGYEYMKKLNQKQFNRELIKLLEVEHATGLQRVDRIPYSFGIEARAPFFDLSLVEYSFQIPSEYKLYQENGEVIEKWVIRETFKDMLPSEIAFRKKAKFSQGVGSELLLRDYFNRLISDREFEAEKEIIKGVIVKSKEELYYWKIFNKEFNVPDDFIRSIPRTSNFTI